MVARSKEVLLSGERDVQLLWDLLEKHKNPRAGTLAVLREVAKVPGNRHPARNLLLKEIKAAYDQGNWFGACSFAEMVLSQATWEVERNDKLGAIRVVARTSAKVAKQVRDLVARAG